MKDNAMADRIINGVEYYRLYITCPVCLDRGGEYGRPEYWRHGNCGGDIYVGSDARYYCDKCGRNEHVLKWKYKCPQCSNVDDYYVGEEGSFASAEAIGTAIATKVCDGLPRRGCWNREFLSNLD